MRQKLKFLLNCEISQCRVNVHAAPLGGGRTAKVRDFIQLERHLADAVHADPGLADAAAAVAALAKASVGIANVASLGGLAGGARSAGVNADGDAQKHLDLEAQDIVMHALKGAPVAAVASEELEDWRLFDAAKPLAVAFDPIDGSGNIEANGAMGTIFSILPARGATNPFVGAAATPLAAGVFGYGPQNTFALSLGDGVDIFTFDRRSKVWALSAAKVRVPQGVAEFAVNAANSRFWEEPVQVYVADCLTGAEGPRTQNYNMRWLGCVAAEAYRILLRGGVYLYPRDARAAYREGRLRLLYEGHPLAFLMEQAGGAASTGKRRVLDVPVASLHQRTPLIMGSAEKVKRIEGLHAAPHARADRAPLFGERGLFRA